MAVIVTFDTANDYPDNFNSFAFGYTYDPVGGITGGAAQVNGGLGFPSSIEAFDRQSHLSVSLFMRYDTGASPMLASGYSLRLGFVGDSAFGTDIFNPNAHFWGEFYNDTELSIWSPGSTDNGFNSIDSFAAPASGNWLKLTFSQMFLGGDEFELSIMLEDFGLTGMESPTLLGSGNLTVDQAAAAADIFHHAAFEGYYNVTHYDNLSVIPEPAPIASGVVGLALLFMVRRNRRSV